MYPDNQRQQRPSAGNGPRRDSHTPGAPHALSGFEAEMEAVYESRNQRAMQQGYVEGNDRPAPRPYDPNYQPPQRAQPAQRGQREAQPAHHAVEQIHRQEAGTRAQVAQQPRSNSQGQYPSRQDNGLRQSAAQQPRPQQEAVARPQPSNVRELHQPASIGEATESAIERDNVHVYGRSAALTFERETRRSGSPTVAIDAAPKAGEKSVKWAEKIRFQVSRNELPLLAGFFLGLVGELEFKFHGEQRNKTLHVINRAPNLMVRVMEGSRAFAVPLAPGDAYAVGCLFLDALSQSRPDLPIEGHMAMIRMACTLHRAGEGAAQGQQGGQQQAPAPEPRAQQRQYRQG